MKSALENIRVLDLSRVLAGPSCTQILGDLGAEIIKVERPGHGDDTRKWGPPFLKDNNGEETTESAYYLSVNRNKKSIAIDITKPEGQELIHEFLEKSDILIHNFRVGSLEKHNLGYEQIKDRHPHLIYCAISGFGQTGPLAEEPGYDFIAQAMGGLMSITGESDGKPMKAGVALSDIMTGLYAAIGVLSALNYRKETGKGQMVDTSLLECTLASLTNIAQYYLTSGQLAPRLGNAHSTIVPYQTFATSDGYLILAIGNDSQFRRFCEIIDKTEWADNPDYTTNSNRVRNREALIPMIEDIMVQKETGYWLEHLYHHDIPVGPVNTVDQTFAMEQIIERKMKIEMAHDETGKQVELVGSPLKLSESPAQYTISPPVLGQHTEDILVNLLNKTPKEIDVLRSKEVL